MVPKWWIREVLTGCLGGTVSSWTRGADPRLTRVSLCSLLPLFSFLSFLSMFSLRTLIIVWISHRRKDKKITKNMVNTVKKKKISIHPKCLTWSSRCWIYQVVLGYQQGQWDQTDQGFQQDLEDQPALVVQGQSQYQSQLKGMREKHLLHCTREEHVLSFGIKTNTLSTLYNVCSSSYLEWWFYQVILVHLKDIDM